MAKNNKKTGIIPLKMADFLTKEVNNKFEDGSIYGEVSPITQDLLRYWFSDSFCDIRNINFHEGQKQAILNIIYLHEVLKVKSVKDLYLSTNPNFLEDMDISELEKDKYQHQMYAIKMATGTGKTWIMNALLIWQYLNAKEGYEGFSKNFLIVTPGLIVYDRLLDAFLGKELENGSRNFDTSDFKKFEELFIPEFYRDTIFGFIQSSVTKKEEIASKVTSDGIIAITNWHMLKRENDDDYDDPFEEPSVLIKKALPISPGTSGGNSLESLDNNYLKGNNIEYLKELDSLVIFNDEAHHIHEMKSRGDVYEAEWQKSLTEISSTKRNNVYQFDFSATPYSTIGKKKIRNYFPHIIVDFNLKQAIHKGLVKLITIDKRKEISKISLDFKAIREGKKIVGLSEGQRVMLRAGLSKLNILSECFSKYDKNKQPKMLVVCEDTNVVPFVKNFFIEEGLSDDEIIEVHSKKKSELNSNDWDNLKLKLFNIDKKVNPKIIISVLMLREGFDVNNICVIVPLRSSEAPILLEQIIGRGLRLMWREPEYNEIKNELRENVLVKKIEPNTQLDVLSIIEHPKFNDFYNEFIDEGIVSEIKRDIDSSKVLGDMITVGLKENFVNYDFYWPIITKEREEVISPMKFNLDDFEAFNISLEELKKIKVEKSEVFESQELTMKTRFGRYKVTKDIINATSYNDFLLKIVNKITSMIQDIRKGTRIYQKDFPLIQINKPLLTETIDDYIRTKLFNQEFDPMINQNYEYLLLFNNKIISHIIRQFSNVVYNMQYTVNIEEAEVEKKYFSDVSELRMRENYSVEVSKSIYECLPYPSNKGGFEKAFIEACDNDSRVDAFIKINEYYHNFATISYIRDDGLLARYYPDFIVKIKNDIFVVETKAKKDISNVNVQSKKLATLDCLSEINLLNGVDRMDAKWNYSLLSDEEFYKLYDKGASIQEILEYSIVTKAKANGFYTLDDF